MVSDVAQIYKPDLHHKKIQKLVFEFRRRRKRSFLYYLRLFEFLPTPALKGNKNG